MPNIRSTALDDTVSNHTSGVKTTDTTLSTPDMPSEYLSAHFIATRLGTSSPNVMLKNASTIVIKMTHTVLIAVIPAEDSMPAAFMIA